MCVPVVSTFHAGIPEAVIHGETGLLGPEGDVCELAKNLLLLLHSQDLRSEYSLRASERIATSFEMANSDLEARRHLRRNSCRQLKARLCQAEGFDVLSRRARDTVLAFDQLPGRNAVMLTYIGAPE